MTRCTAIDFEIRHIGRERLQENITIGIDHAEVMG
jgi:hypothetical protein